MHEKLRTAMVQQQYERCVIYEKHFVNITPAQTGWYIGYVYISIHTC